MTITQKILKGIGCYRVNARPKPKVERRVRRRPGYGGHLAERHATKKQRIAAARIAQAEAAAKAASQSIKPKENK